MSTAVLSLWWREVLRFVRQRSRLTGALQQPLVFWLLLGGGLSASFRPPGVAGEAGYLAYFYPGILALVLLFTAIFSTIAVVEDRRSGFLQGVIVAPISRPTIVLGQACGATSLAVGQGALFLLLAPLVGLSVDAGRFLGALGAMTIVGFGLVNLGLMIAWRMESTQGFHAIMNLLLLPIWFLSGAMFPAEGLPAPLAVAMSIDPLTYGVALLRRCVAPEGVTFAGPSLATSLVVSLGFAVLCHLGAVAVARRSSTL